MHRFLVTAVLVVGLVACGGAQKQHAKLQKEGEQFRAELAELYVAKGAKEAAVPLLQRILSDHPDDARSRVLYGTVLRDLGLYPQAERELRHVVDNVDDRPDAHAALGILLDLTGRHDEALEHHQAAAKLAPGDASYRNNLGFSLLAAGDAEGAIPPLETALALDPGLPQSYTNLGFAYGRAGRLDDAERTLRAGLGEAAALHDLALIHEERGELDRADDLRAQAYALDPDLRPMSDEEAP